LELELTRLIQSLSPTTMFTDASSPQSLALEWLLGDTYSLASSRAVQLQRFALAAFWYSTGGPNTWMNDPPWLTPVDECTEWRSEQALSDIRITCSSSVVTRISISVPEVAGTLPEEMVLLSGLESIFLSSNLLVGTLPANIGLWTSLQQLIVTNNNLEGTLPTEIGQLTRLTELSLNSNRLEGEVPTQLANLLLLDKLDLTGNQLSGTIHVSLCELGVTTLRVDCADIVCDCCDGC